MTLATPVHVFDSPEALGNAAAERILACIRRGNLTNRRVLIGCPTGRTPRPVLAALAQRLAVVPEDLSRVVLVMMDEYLVPGREGLEYAPADAPWSCHHYARTEIARRLNDVVPPAYRVQGDSIWFPDPSAPERYDERIHSAGGIDLFVLASGASDGHVAFNPPGSPRDSRTRIIPLSDETRRDNLQTFPSFGTIAAVPRHGISVGIATIADAREAMMLVWGPGKRLTLGRMREARRYQPDWPATVIHECGVPAILADEAAAGGPAGGS